MGSRGWIREGNGKKKKRLNALLAKGDTNFCPVDSLLCLPRAVHAGCVQPPFYPFPSVESIPPCTATKGLILSLYLHFHH